LIYIDIDVVTYGRGSVLLWRRCDVLCSSGFIDDVMLSHNGPWGLESCRYHCSSVVRRLTPSVYVLDDGGRRGYRRVSCKRYQGRSLRCTVALFQVRSSRLTVYALHGSGHCRCFAVNHERPSCITAGWDASVLLYMLVIRWR